MHISCGARAALARLASPEFYMQIKFLQGSTVRKATAVGRLTCFTLMPLGGRYLAKNLIEASFSNSNV